MSIKSSVGSGSLIVELLMVVSVQSRASWNTGEQ